MADLSHDRRPPIVVPSSGVRLLPPAARFVLRGGAQVLRAAGEALGLQISGDPCSSARREGRAALWLGPDEQQLLAPMAEGASVARSLAEKLVGLPCSLVDVSHRQVALEVSGPHAQTLLSVGCPLDLDVSAFPVGMCTRTVLGRAAVILWRTQAQTFQVEVWRSFADYASRLLAEAGRELAC